jgi:hypothetical protein
VVILMSGIPKENEVRRLLSKALSRRRRKADAPNVHNALHLDLNKEFEEPRGGSLKYFFVILMLFALLIFAVSQMVGLERSLG